MDAAKRALSDAAFSFRGFNTRGPYSRLPDQQLLVCLPELPFFFFFFFCYSTRDPLSPSQREPPNNRAAVVVQPP
jgi:hypothetical protein